MQLPWIFVHNLQLPPGRGRRLPQEERKHDQSHEEASRQRADAGEIALDVGVIGVEFRAARRGRCHAHGSRRSSGFLSHFFTPIFRHTMTG